MIRSIRQFLLISLLVSITITSSVTAIGNYLLDKQIIQPYLDNQLLKLFTFIERLSYAAEKDPGISEKIHSYLDTSRNKNVKNLFFQVQKKSRRPSGL